MNLRLPLHGKFSTTQLLWLVFVLIPALYVNLGMMPLIGDEAIRATVALEMMLSGDFVTPTLAGNIYLNKPPLYNWILTAFFSVAGSESEFMVRLPSTLFLILYSISIFLWIRKPLGKQNAILTALAFLSCSRILFWDSFLGLIDICYSWIMFSNFMIIWHCFRKQSYNTMFFASYLLVAIGFLLKGLPAIVFQGITLLSVVIIERKMKILLSWRHFAGMGIFIIITGSYYLTYYFRNPDHFTDLMLRLVSESTQKSAIGAGFEKTILHLFTFPFEIMYHFLPWTLLVVFIFHKRILRKAMINRFVLYCTVIFMANSIVYWLSPTTYPRYLLMLMPLLFIILLQLSRYHAIANTMNCRVVAIVFLIFAFGIALAGTLLPVIFASKLPVQHLYYKACVLLILNLLVIYSMLKNRNRAGLLYYIVILLLISRISFNLFLVPYRQSESWLTMCRNDAIELAQKTKSEELYYMTDTITTLNVYILTRERREILRFRGDEEQGPYYLISETTKYNGNFLKEFSMRVPYYHRSYFAGKFINAKP